MPRFRVEKNTESGEYEILDNLAHESLNDYDIAFSKAYALAGDGVDEEVVMSMQTHDNPEYDKGLLDGWAQYQVDASRGSIEDNSIMMHDSLKSALYKYSIDKSDSNFHAVLDAYRKLKDDDSDDHLTVTEEGDDLNFVYKYKKDELGKAKKLMEENPDLKISSYDEESGELILKDVKDSKVVKFSDSYLGIFKGTKLKSIICR